MRQLCDLQLSKGLPAAAGGLHGPLPRAPRLPPTLASPNIPCLGFRVQGLGLGSRISKGKNKVAKGNKEGTGAALKVLLTLCGHLFFWFGQHGPARRESMRFPRKRLLKNK